MTTNKKLKYTSRFRERTVSHFDCVLARAGSSVGASWARLGYLVFLVLFLTYVAAKTMAEFLSRHREITFSHLDCVLEPSGSSTGASWARLGSVLWLLYGLHGHQEDNKITVAVQRENSSHLDCVRAPNTFLFG